MNQSRYPCWKRTWKYINASLRCVLIEFTICFQFLFSLFRFSALFFLNKKLLCHHQSYFTVTHFWYTRTRTHKTNRFIPTQFSIVSNYIFFTNDNIRSIKSFISFFLFLSLSLNLLLACLLVQSTSFHFNSQTKFYLDF